MTRPTILDLDLVVVPREAAQVMLDEVTAADQHEPFSDTTMSGIFDSMLSASPYHTAWDDGRKYVEGLERKEARASASLSGLLEALAHHTGERHGIMAIRHLVDRALSAEARIAELEKRLAGAERVIEPFAKAAQEIDERFYSETGGQGPLGGGNFVTIMPLGDEWEVATLGHLRAARAYMEGK